MQKRLCCVFIGQRAASRSCRTRRTAAWSPGPASAGTSVRRTGSSRRRPPPCRGRSRPRPGRRSNVGLSPGLTKLPKRARVVVWRVAAGSGAPTDARQATPAAARASTPHPFVRRVRPRRHGRDGKQRQKPPEQYERPTATHGTTRPRVIGHARSPHRPRKARRDSTRRGGGRSSSTKGTLEGVSRQVNKQAAIRDPKSEFKKPKQSRSKPRSRRVPPFPACRLTKARREKRAADVRVLSGHSGGHICCDESDLSPPSARILRG